MKKPRLSLLVLLTLLFAAFILGFSAGKYSHSGNIVVSVPVPMLTEPTESHVNAEDHPTVMETTAFPININSAEKEDFMALPGIGEVLAQRIMTYRSKNGYFSHVTDLMNVEGIGQTRMEAILDYVTVGG